MVFAALASVLSAAFAVVVFLRFRRSRRPAFAAWTLGLLIFAGAAAFQAAGETGGWTPPNFRGFYLLGGVLGVIYLALGTIFLMAPRRVAWGCAIVLAVITIVLAIDAAVIPVDAAKLTTAKGVLGDAIQQGSLLFIGVVFLNILGTLILVGGSAWSAYRLSATGRNRSRHLQRAAHRRRADHRRRVLRSQDTRHRQPRHPRGLRGSRDRDHVRRLPRPGSSRCPPHQSPPGPLPPPPARERSAAPQTRRPGGRETRS